MSVGPTPPVGGPPPGPLATGQAVSAAAAATPLAQAPDPVATLTQRAVEAARADAAIRQSGQGPLLADLSRALESPHLPATLKAAIRQLLAFGLNAGAPPDAAALRAAVARSGLFLEARLAQTPTAPPNDMKAALLALSQALTAAGATSAGRPARATAAPPTRGGGVAGQAARAAILRADDPPEQQLAILRDETDQALARQTLHQLASLPDDAGQRWMFELPMMTPQGAAVAQFAIERDDPPPGGGPDAAPTRPLRAGHPAAGAGAGPRAAARRAQQCGPLGRARGEPGAPARSGAAAGAGAVGRGGRPSRRAAGGPAPGARRPGGPQLMTDEPPRPLAVALRYDAPDAPRVVAVGRGELGQRIIDTAREHGVPLEAHPGLAEALSTSEPDTAIPEALYEAVAVVIAFILQAAREPRGAAPIHR